jgi:hypothetical protein
LSFLGKALSVAKLIKLLSPGPSSILVLRETLLQPWRLVAKSEVIKIAMIDIFQAVFTVSEGCSSFCLISNTLLILHHFYQIIINNLEFIAAI